jgi:hypothetical protein
MNLSRESIIDRYRQRITNGNRSKLAKSELESLIADFIQQLAAIKSRTRIESLCLTETMGKVYLPMYHKAIKLAINGGVLPLVKATSHKYSYSKRSGEIVELFAFSLFSKFLQQSHQLIFAPVSLLQLLIIS